MRTPNYGRPARGDAQRGVWTHREWRDGRRLDELEAVLLGFRICAFSLGNTDMSGYRSIEMKGGWLASRR